MNNIIQHTRNASSWICHALPNRSITHPSETTQHGQNSVNPVCAVEQRRAETNWLLFVCRPSISILERASVVLWYWRQSRCCLILLVLTEIYLGKITTSDVFYTPPLTPRVLRWNPLYPMIDRQATAKCLFISTLRDTALSLTVFSAHLKTHLFSHLMT